MNILTKTALIIASVIGVVPAFDADACTRVVYAGKNGNVVTGRTLDWRTPIPTSLRIMPRGISRVSYDSPDGIQWVSRYGSVVSIGYDMGASEGLNEKGLCVNCLYLPGTVYTKANETRKKMSSSVWVMYVLDNFATVDEAVAELSKDRFYIDAPDMPEGSAATLHMAISDATGNNGIIEYIDGELSI
ncbi:MAG: linear amide C-N hydrolase, partial [Muribaculaceae bacterium]|nr:linear amide C-N hydrolase [Muribaculaceae bacterium]